MPELPEVEHLKRTLEPVLCGSCVAGVRLRRRDIVRYNETPGDLRDISKQLLEGTMIDRLERRGKQLALIGKNGRVLIVQLGMTGSLRVAHGKKSHRYAKHTHCIWNMKQDGCNHQLLFHDPRRFGGLAPFHSFDLLIHTAWSQLGPDALQITTREVRRRLEATGRCIKAALMDQSFIAGIGNIYADEILFAAGIHPKSQCRAIPGQKARTLAKALRTTLRSAVRAGGSTIRDYVDGNGKAGWFSVSHKAYGRHGQPCMHCKTLLEKTMVVQRTTSFCPSCQEHYL